jgi:hypothetical protein
VLWLFEAVISIEPLDVVWWEKELRDGYPKTNNAAARDCPTWILLLLSDDAEPHR